MAAGRRSSRDIRNPEDWLTMGLEWLIRGGGEGPSTWLHTLPSSTWSGRVDMPSPACLYMAHRPLVLTAGWRVVDSDKYL